MSGTREGRARCKPSSFRLAAVKRAAAVGLLLLGLLAAHVVYWYVPRERAEAPRLPRAAGVAGRGGSAEEPLRLLAGDAYDVCVWIPYPHQNLGVLAAAAGDLQEVVAAAARLSAGEPALPRSKEPEEPPTFGPFEVPPASEMAACTDLAGGRLRVVARIYPALALVARLAGRLAGNPWLAGGDAGRSHIAWQGHLWSVTAGEAARAGSAGAGPVGGGATARSALLLDASAGDGLPARFPKSLAIVHWAGARPEIPAGYYALTRDRSNLVLTLIGAAGAPGSGAAPALALSPAAPFAALLVAVGPDWRGGADPSQPFSQARPPAALALFETGGSRLSSLGDLPGLAVFNVAGPPGTERWRLPAEGIFRLMAGRLPAAEAAGWRILALDSGSLRQAEAIAPRLAPLLPAGGGGSASALAAGGVPAASAPAAGHAPAAIAPAAGAPLSLGVWLDPRSTLRMVARIRHFVETFPLAPRRQIELWRDWETVLDPLADCEHASLAATASPPALRLELRGCSASPPR